MTTAVDTSVLLDVFAASSQRLAASQNALRQWRQHGRIIVCDVVVAELRPNFRDDAALADALFTILGADYVPCDRASAMLAGATWQEYRAAGGTRQRMIPDFLIAAHAQTSADRLLSRDRGFFRRWFADLDLVEPG